MQIFNEIIPIEFKDSLPKKYSTDNILFFDIETTGLSPASSYIFLIGCGYFKENTLILTQWLMDNLSDEPLIIKSFFDFAASFKRVVHYNGSTFDIPFLQKRGRLYNISETFFKAEASDVYKNLCKYKKLFKAPDYKLKTIEKLSGFQRTDRLEGMQLIDMFTKYIGRRHFEALCTYNGILPSEALITDKRSGLISVPSESSAILASLLLLHNKEDILGLVQLCSLLNIEKLIDGDFIIDSFIHDEASLFIRLKTLYIVPPVYACFDLWALEKQDDYIYIEASLEHARAFLGDSSLSNEMLLYDYTCSLLKKL